LGDWKSPKFSNMVLFILRLSKVSYLRMGASMVKWTKEMLWSKA
jgi:hypothetical protein